MSLTIKRHYRLLAGLALVLGGLAWGLHDARIVAYTVPSANPPVLAGTDYANDVPLFDDTVVHSVQLLITEADYQAMITTYQETGAKDYFHADIVIDGVLVSDVGVRLKGNASLRNALGGGMGGGGGAGGPGNRDGGQRAAPGGGNAPQGQGMAARAAGGPADAQGALPSAQDQSAATGQALPGGQARAGGQAPADAAGAAPQGGQAPTEGQMPAGGGMPANGEMPGEGEMPAGAANEARAAAAPEAATTNGRTVTMGETKIPLLVKFNEFVSGQTYQGYSAMAIRTYGTTQDESMLQEPITNYVFIASGLSAAQTAFAGVAINDGDEQLYTISEILNDTYVSLHMENPGGVLYKAEVGAGLTYQGDDPSLYARSFTQQTRVNDADMGPLIDLMQFITEADDATFERELDEHLDVESLAAYLAINNLLVNTDSLVGMSNNYYLYYDEVTGRFTLLMWDGNESLGKMGRGEQAATYDIYFSAQDGAAGGRMGGGMGGGRNLLVTRFLASEQFMALYEQKLAEVYETAFASGAMAAKIEEYATLVHAANADRSLVDTERYDQAVDEVLAFVAQRSAYLATTPLLGGQAVAQLAATQ